MEKACSGSREVATVQEFPLHPNSGSPGLDGTQRKEKKLANESCSPLICWRQIRLDCFLEESSQDGFL